MNKLTALIARHEGLRLKPYKDTVGKLTIGYGRNLSDNGITMTEADILLQNDLRDAKSAAKSYSWFAGLNEPRQAVVIDMIFNLGVVGFSRFTATQRAIEAADWELAASHMLDSKWALQVGRRAREDAEMMRTGEWVVEV